MTYQLTLLYQAVPAEIIRANTTPGLPTQPSALGSRVNTPVRELQRFLPPRAIVSGSQLILAGVAVLAKVGVAICLAATDPDPL